MEKKIAGFVAKDGKIVGELLEGSGETAAVGPITGLGPLVQFGPEEVEGAHGEVVFVSGWEAAELTEEERMRAAVEAATKNGTKFSIKGGVITGYMNFYWVEEERRWQQKKGEAFLVDGHLVLETNLASYFLKLGDIGVSWFNTGSSGIIAEPEPDRRCIVIPVRFKEAVETGEGWAQAVEFEIGTELEFIALNKDKGGFKQFYTALKEMERW